MFIDTLPIIFQYSHLIGPFEARVFGGLFGVLFISAPFPVRTVSTGHCSWSGIYQYAYKSWFGELSMGFLFWPFFLILNGVLYGADSMAQAGTISVSSWGNIHMMLAGPVIWWTVAVWRGSARTGSRWWSACARLGVLCAYIEYALRLYIRNEFPRIFFNCEELLLDYFSCF